ncbi:MAG: sugar phosphate nucleotidyltransferase [Bacteroidetes bacterium]|nr:sugar phosphate nucleotidyltransferase [Bacteroidota bacterium]
MNVIIPMAGLGKSLRPHTLTIPKPLIPIAGKPIVQRLVEDIAKVCKEEIQNVGFVIGAFGKEVEMELINIAAKIGAKGKVYQQAEPLGTAHAVLCAKELLWGKTIVAFADTLFKADFQLDIEQEAIVWVQKVEDPQAFGVVVVNKQNEIEDFVEKPKSFVSDLAIIGIYYFQKGQKLKQEIQFMIDNNQMDDQEFQLTRALETLKNKGVKFVPGEVSDWLDCGNKNATVITNKKYLEYIKDNNLVAESSKKHNSVIIPPVYIGENVELYNSVIGPYVSIGDHTTIKDSRIQNSIIQKDNLIINANLSNSMLGNFVNFKGSSSDLSIGDYNVVSE